MRGWRESGIKGRVGAGKRGPARATLGLRRLGCEKNTPAKWDTEAEMVQRPRRLRAGKQSFWRGTVRTGPCPGAAGQGASDGVSPAVYRYAAAQSGSRSRLAGSASSDGASPKYALRISFAMGKL